MLKKEHLGHVEKVFLEKAELAAKKTSDADPYKPDYSSQTFGKSETAHTQEGQKILRYFSTQGNPAEKRTAYITAKLPFFSAFADSTEVRIAQKKKVRTLAVMIDVDLPQLPSLEQQFAIMQAYASANPMILWDGWDDTAVQYMRPDLGRPTLASFPVSEYMLYYAWHAQHIAITSLTMLGQRSDYQRLPLSAAMAGKTLAVLDAGVDTLHHPSQITALAAAYTAPTTSRLSAAIGQKLVPKSGGIGWKRISNGRTSVQDNAFRQSAAAWVAQFEREPPKFPASYTYIQDVVNRYFPRLRIGTDAKRLTLSAIYIAHKLLYPKSLNMQVARAIARFGKMDILSGEPFNRQKAEQLLSDLTNCLEKANFALVHARSRRYATTVSNIMRRRYEPGLPSPWVIEGLKRVPNVVTDVEEMPDFLKIPDEQVAARRILSEMGLQHLCDNPQFVAPIAAILCAEMNRSLTALSDAQSKIGVNDPIPRPRRPLQTKKNSSSTPLISTSTASPTPGSNGGTSPQTPTSPESKPHSNA